MHPHEIYMHRCLQLARLAEGDVAPNPMVGAVLVHKGEIIGEGYHKEYGKGHAEVACLASVSEENKPLISVSTLYVSLEPCAHFGKTPPCADLIITNKIPEVVIGCRDPFVAVNGKGIEKLKAAGVSVTVGILEEECKELNKRFFLFHTSHRPYVVLKWAQTADRKISSSQPGSTNNISHPAIDADGADTEPSAGLQNRQAPRLFISNAFTNRLVHKWRSEEMAILVGTNTAIHDNPELSVRTWPGKNPIRVVVDMNLRLPSSLKLFSGETPTIVFNLHRHTLPFEIIDMTELRQLGVAYYQVTEDVSLVHQMLNGLYHLGIQSILVEGGTQLLQSFIDEGAWDEARVITNEQLIIGSGLPAPQLSSEQLSHTDQLFSDTVRYYVNSPKP